MGQQITEEHSVANHVYSVKIVIVLANERTTRLAREVAKRMQRFGKSLHLNPFDFFFWGRSKLLETEATEEDVTARIVVSLADIASTADLFELVQQL
ncbi:hypothetical protein TNCV_646731 [Trichonephila clavipes]|nr:hypothetical protein TNCV_646731 [Trichonephila clavipes]